MSLVELTVGALVALIVLGVVMVYVITTTRIDRAQETDLDALDELQFARAELVKELRFARSVTSPEPNTVTAWVDLDLSGGSGPDSPGEDVTWQIADGRLGRSEDGAGAVTWASDLDPTASSLTVDGNTVSVVLVATVDRGFTDEARTLRGSVTVRNAP